MLWDEEAQEWKPRWGYNRAGKGGVEDQAIIEVKPGDDPNADPWTEARHKKKARVEKNLLQQQKNLGLIDTTENGGKGKKGGRRGERKGRLLLLLRCRARRMGCRWICFLGRSMKGW